MKYGDSKVEDHVRVGLILRIVPFRLRIVCFLHNFSTGIVVSFRTPSDSTACPFKSRSTNYQLPTPVRFQLFDVQT